MKNSKNRKFKFLSHTADVKFQAFGRTIEEAFVNSAMALKETMAENVKVNAKIKKKIKIKGRDNESLLYNFLEEFLYLLDAEDFLLSKINRITIKNNKLKAEINGDSAIDYNFTNNVKAVTYNEMFIKKDKGKFVIQAVLDV